MKLVRFVSAVAVPTLLVLTLLLSCGPQATPVPTPTPAPATPAPAATPRVTPAAPAPEAAPAPRPAPAARPAWETEWEKTLAEARKEGRVVLIASFGILPARGALVKGVKDKYGIDLEVVPGRGSELIAKVKAERRAGIYAADVAAGGSSTPIQGWIPDGLAEPIRPALILPEVKDPKMWMDIYGKGDLPIIDKGGYIFMAMGDANSYIVINTDLVNPQEIRRHKDLLNPKWKGKIVMDLPTRSGPGNTWLYLVSEVLGYGQGFFREFLKQQPVVNTDARQLVEWVAREKKYIAVGAAGSYVQPLRDIGLPIAMVSDMDEKRIAEGGGAHITLMNKPPHPNAQKVLVNFLLSKEGQTIISKALGTPSLRVDVPQDHLFPETVPIPGKVYFQTEEDVMAREKVYKWSADIMKEMGY